MDFMDEDLAVLEYMEKTEVVIKARYIKTGYFSIPRNDALDRTAKSLREMTCEAIRKSGTFVRA